MKISTASSFVLKSNHQQGSRERIIHSFMLKRKVKSSPATEREEDPLPSKIELTDIHITLVVFVQPTVSG